MTKALDEMVRRLEMFVGDQDEVDFEARLDLGDIGSLLIEQERCHVNRHLGMNRRGVFLHGLFLEQAQHVQRAGLGVTNDAGAITARASDV